MNPSTRCLYLVALLLLMGPSMARAQSDVSSTVDDNVELFAPLDLPDADQYRSGAGEPGPAYWQQRADYRIEVALEPATHRITGSGTITYTNNAPDALSYLWLQLDQNLFRPDSRGRRINPPDSRWRGAFEAGGYDISNLALVRGGEEHTPEYLINDTRMQIRLDEPLEPGQQIDIRFDYAFTIPPYGADRMGRLEVEQGIVYELAQWYPRMYVYDDVSGWNPMPYLGQGEFYLEYGTFDVRITVPHSYLVAATGELMNPEEVLTDEQQQRLDEARTSTETVMIVDREEAGTAASRPEGDGPLTWHFVAENVRDFAWAASDAFIWDAAGYDGKLMMSFYPQEGISEPGGEEGWEQSTQMVRQSIEHYSEMWYPYPYPVAINVAGIVGGMEYPMIVFCSVNARGRGLYGVTTHELGHEWFPMIVGSDERRYAWMDEGFNTFINYYATEAYYGEVDPRYGNAGAYLAVQMTSDQHDLPILTYPDRIPFSSLGFLAYRKPGLGLVLLREYVLGPERFDEAFQAYIRRWAYKHPQPADFYRTMENVSGEDLDWFWRGWLHTNETFDQAIVSVTLDSTETTARVTLENRDGLVMPAEVELRYEDGRTERRRVPVEAFFKTDEYVFDAPADGLQAIQLNPDGYLPDVAPENDTWTRPSMESGD